MNVHRGDLYSLETPEKIRINYELASPLARLGAFFIDNIIISFIITLITIIYYIIVINNMFTAEHFSKLLNSIFIFLIYMLVFALQWGYYILFEMLLNGKSPGKMLFRIRVVKYDGSFYDFNSSVLRNFIRLFDFNISMGAAAFFSMILNKDFRRIGDIVANTVVVKDPNLHIRLPDFKVKNFDVNSIDQAKMTKKLSEKDLYVIRTFLNSENAFNTAKKLEVAGKIMFAIKKKLNDETEVKDPVEYLKKIYAGHHNER